MNTVATSPATIVAKENVSLLIFPKTEVLFSTISQAERALTIVKAMKLGNNGKSKVKIIFEDADGLKKVETTVWGVTEKNIILKKGTLIPIHRIHDIKFY